MELHTDSVDINPVSAGLCVELEPPGRLKYWRYRHECNRLKRRGSVVSTTLQQKSRMSTNATTANSSYDRVEQLAEKVDELEEIVEQQQSTIDEQQSTIDDLEEQLSEHQQHSGKERAELNQRVSDVEEATDGGEGDTSPSDPNGVDEETTALEQVCALPEATANSSLSNNQRRARFVAADINDYAKRCTAGRTLSSSDIATILKSGTDCKGRTQTVARVMEFLDKLGGNNVKVVKRRGTKRVVFNEEYADRLSNVESGNGCRYDNTAVGVI